MVANGRNDNDACRKCNLIGDDQSRTWIECEDCLSWYHADCVDVSIVDGNVLHWQCTSCRENRYQKALQTIADMNVKFVNLQKEMVQIRETQMEAQLKSDNRHDNYGYEQSLSDCSHSRAGSPCSRINLEDLETPRIPKPRFHNSTQNIPTGMHMPAINHDTVPSNNTDGVSELVLMMKRQMLEQLPVYAGGTEGWPTFYAQYIATNREGKFQPHDNLRRLNNCLKGEARMLVEGKLMYSNLVDEIVYDLWRRWGRSDTNVKQIVRKLTAMPAPHPYDRAAIMKFRIELSNSLAVLRSLMAENYINSPTIPDTISEHFHIEWKKKWAVYVSRHLSSYGGDATLQDLVQWVMNETEWVLLIPDTDTKTRKEPSKRNMNVFVHEETEAVEVASQYTEKNEKATKRSSCCFCNSTKHRKVIECEQFKAATVKKRWECAKQKYLCFVCLDKFHRKECPDKKACGINNCEMSHHPLLHYEAMKQAETEQPVNIINNGKTIGNTTIFRVIPVEVHANGITVNVNAFFDEGSSPTMVTQELAEKLGISGVVQPLCIKWTDGTVRTENNSQCVTLQVSGIGNHKKFTMNDVRTVSANNLDLPEPDWDIEQVQNECPHLRNLNMHPPIKAKPELLIGLEHPKLGLPREVREGNERQPVATRTVLGWVIHGKLKESDSYMQRCCVVCECEPRDDDLEKLVNGYFSTEYFGVRCVEKTVEATEIEHARKILKETTKNLGGQYETGLLWKPVLPKIPDSRPMALRRLACLERQMARDNNMAEAIRHKIQENVDKGFARKLTKLEAENRGPRCWYLPIFTVTNPHKPKKVRVVYDAAAKVNGIALNDCLTSGPDLLKPLIGLLWRARQGIVAVAGDTRDMFHCVKILREDQDSQRFLWRDGDSSREPDEYVMLSMTFGATCSPCSAQHVKNENARQYNDRFPRAVTTIVENHYVDDMLDSFDSESEALETTKQVIWIQNQAGFEVRNWLSNSKHVLTQLNGKKIGESNELSLNMEEDNTDKILGIYWNINKDHFIFKLNFVRVDPEIVKMNTVPTKRGILRTVMSVYDPHGFALPELVHAKILLQDIWRKQVDWDQPIPEELFQQWCTWLKNLRNVENIAIPRCYSPRIPEATNIQLHTFVDASELAYAAVSYFRIVSPYNVDVAFIASKNKVAPRKHLSVPRLELQAAVLGARLAATIAHEHTIRTDEKYYWSDSQTVLCWIRSDHRRYKQFVANRISEVLDTTRIAEWKWIPGTENVADLATKRHPEINFKEDGVWFNGPKFLSLPQGDWPKWTNRSLQNIEETNEEARVHFKQEVIDQIINIDENRFSKWARIQRTVGWVIRARKLFKKTPYAAGELTPEELEEAEQLLLKKSQQESFGNEIMQIKAGKYIKKESTMLKKLSPIYDSKDGLVKVKGRIDAVPDIPIEMKRPIILDKENKLTMLIIEAYHQRYHHSNHETTVNEIRQRFWISGLRRAVRTVIEKCQVCRMRRAKPEIPEMSPLPYERLAVGEYPFSHTGMDYFGPLTVTVGRRHEKRYGVLFTCLTTRAVYVELASSLDTNACIMAIRSLMNRRGVPKTIWCDNGTNLRGAEVELSKAFNQLNRNKLQAEAIPHLPGQREPIWHFITPRAPHMGGAWERMVRSIKTILYSCLKERAPKADVLRSFLIEAEGIVNSRPLTYMPLHPESQEALTPNHALRMAGLTVYAPGEFEGKELKKPWRMAQQLAQEFWHRFVREYLPELTTRTKWFQDGRVIQKEDLVIIIEEDAPRNLWERGRVIEVHPGADGKIRTATIKTMRAIRKRPVSRLALLNVQQ